MKKEWTTPELVIMVRGRPEEAVLGFCKSCCGTIGPDYKNCDSGDISIQCLGWSTS
jgi:hypothetical protein